LRVAQRLPLAFGAEDAYASGTSVAMRSPVPIKIVPVVLVVSVLGAGAFAIFGDRGSARVTPEPSSAEPVAPVTPAPPLPEIPADPHGGALPPNHPPIGAAGSAPGMLPPSSDEPAALTWKTPSGWQTAANPSAMRLATYRIPHVAGDSDDAEVSVIRAGGSTEANIQRWLGQFEEAGQDKRTTKTVQGFKVTIVEVSGTFMGGGPMMGGGGAAPSAHKGWTLLAAIVETAESPYFFKMTGPSATVKAAHPGFDALIDSVAATK
jgi:hypothetical protein